LRTFSLGKNQAENAVAVLGVNLFLIDRAREAEAPGKGAIRHLAAVIILLRLLRGETFYNLAVRGDVRTERLPTAGISAS